MVGEYAIQFVCAFGFLYCIVAHGMFTGLTLDLRYEAGERHYPATMEEENRVLIVSAIWPITLPLYGVIRVCDYFWPGWDQDEA